MGECSRAAKTKRGIPLLAAAAHLRSGAGGPLGAGTGTGLESLRVTSVAAAIRRSRVPHRGSTGLDSLTLSRP